MFFSRSATTTGFDLSRLSFLPGLSRLSGQGGKEPVVVGLDVANGWLTLAWRRTGRMGRAERTSQVRGATERHKGSAAPPEWTPILEGVHTIRIPEGIDWTTPGCAELIRNELNSVFHMSFEMPSFGSSVRSESSDSYGNSDSSGNSDNTKNRNNAHNVWIRLGEQHGETRHYRIPKIRTGDRDTIAGLAAHRQKTFDETLNLFDYRIGNEISDRGVIRVPVTALVVPKKAVFAVQEQAHAVGIVPMGLTSAPVGIQNLYASGWLACPWEQFVFVEIGEESSRMALFMRDRMELSRTIKAGMHSLVSALQNDAPVSPQEMPLETAWPDVPNLKLLSREAPISCKTPLSFHETDIPNNVTEASGTEASGTEDQSHTPLLEKLFRVDRSPEEEAELLERLASPLRRLGHQLQRTVANSISPLSLETPVSSASKMPQPTAARTPTLASAEAASRESAQQVALPGVVLSAPPCCASLVLKTFADLGFQCQLLQLDGVATPEARKELQHAATLTPKACLTQAIGLCLSNTTYTPNMFLTCKEQHHRTRQTRLSRLALGGAALLTVLIGLSGINVHKNMLDLQQEKTLLQARLASRERSFTSDELRTTFALTQKRHTNMRSVEKRRLAAALVSELSDKTPNTVQLSSLRVTFPPVTLPGFSEKMPAFGSTETTRRSSNRPGSVQKDTTVKNAVAVLTGTLSGDVLQRESYLAEFLKRLELSPLVQSLRIEKQQDSDERTLFVATLTLV